MAKGKGGFASLTPEQRREVGRKGGLSGKPENRAFRRDPDLASRAGVKGSAARWARGHAEMTSEEEEEMRALREELFGELRDDKTPHLDVGQYDYDWE